VKRVVLFLAVCVDNKSCTQIW